MVDKEKIKEVLDKVRVSLQADGGDAELAVDRRNKVLWRENAFHGRMALAIGRANHRAARRFAAGHQH